MMALKQARSQSNLFRPWNPEDGKEEERKVRKEKRREERRKEEKRKDERKKSSSNLEDTRQLDKTGLIPSSESQEMIFHHNHSPSTFDPSFSSAFAQHLMTYPQFTNLPLLPFHQVPNPYLSANPAIPPTASGQFDTALQFLTAAAAGETLFRNPKKQRPKRFSCPHCQVSFSNNGQLRGHIRIHTGEFEH